MELTIDQALQQGVAAHKEGKLQDAERLYRAILQALPAHPDANHNLGVLAVAVGKPLEAIPLFQMALEANPQIEQFWLSYIEVLIQVGRLEEAKKVLVNAEQSGVSAEKLNVSHQQFQDISWTDARPLQDQLSSLLRYYQAGSYAEAEVLALSLTEQFPKHAFGWQVLGVLLKREGRLNESLLPMQKAVELSPQDAEARSNLGVMLKDLGRLDEAEACFSQAIELRPEFAEAHNNLGNTLKELGKPDEAKASYKQAVALKPEFAEAHSNLGVTLQELGKLDESEVSLRQAIAIKPDFAKAHYNLGNTLNKAGKLEEAVARHRLAIEIKPDFVEAHSNLGVTLKNLGRFEEAVASFRQAIALEPDYAKAYSNLGITLQEVGRLDDAEASLRQAIALKPDFAEAHRNLAATKKFSSKDEQICQLEGLYRDPTISEHERCLICFSLAKASDDLGDLANAFQLYAEGNALRKKKLRYDKAQDTDLFQALKASYPRIKPHSLAPEIVTHEYAPVFVLGLPRSGTTLVEQIISSHQQVTGAGELPFLSQFGRPLAVGQTLVDGEVLETFRGQYLEALRQRSEGNAIVTDKMPHNFHLLGLITVALPEARIIHVRRDSAAVCWASYTQYFVNDSLGYCYSLEDILHYHGLYEDLMKFWHQALPGRIYDLDYERLTKDQEQETRKLIDHLGLNWDDACLSPQNNKRGVGTASNLQVRQKVYQGSSEKWKRYRPYLNGALDHLSVDKR
jgi:tetratricopeptide (TPR) repeat protein